MKRTVVTHIEQWPTRIPFRITGHTWYSFDAVFCEIEQNGLVGRGEGMPVYYCDETELGMLDAIETIRPALEDGACRNSLLDLMPPCGARNAVDAALWDLECQLEAKNAWTAAVGKCEPIETVMTIGLEPEPEAMGEAARNFTDYTLFKVKLDGDRPVERIAAIRAARADARIVIDANQGWSFAQLQEVAPQLAELGVSMIEQPLPRGGDAELESYESPVPLCADESCLHLGELDETLGRYQMINIKLDKAGGLTHGLQLAEAARQHGLGLMVGCMGGTSTAMAPSHVLAQVCDLADIDGPLLLRQDSLGGLVYNNGSVTLPEKPFWGIPR